MKKSLLFVFICYLSHLTANQEAKQDSTEHLIQFIQQEDQRLQEAKKFYDYFYKECTYKTSEVRGNTRYTYTYIKSYTSDDIITKFYNAKDVIKNFKNESIKEIQNYINAINTIDTFGKTPLEYAQTSEMYNILRSHGAHFQLDSYMKIYPWRSTTLFRISLFTAVYAAYIIYTYNPLRTDTSMQTIPDIDTSNLEEQLSKKEINLTVQDTFGRTFLMNYLIQQNQQLEKVNQKIKKLPQQSLELYQMQYTKANLIITTEKNIKTMIEQNASIELYDSFSKNCLNYCKIKELRNLFKKPGTINFVHFLLFITSINGLIGELLL